MFIDHDKHRKYIFVIFRQMFSINFGIRKDKFTVIFYLVGSGQSQSEFVTLNFYDTFLDSFAVEPVTRGGSRQFIRLKTRSESGPRASGFLKLGLNRKEREQQSCNQLYK